MTYKGRGAKCRGASRMNQITNTACQLVRGRTAWHLVGELLKEKTHRPLDCVTLWWMETEERRFSSNLMTSLALYLPRIIHSTSPLLNISLLYSASVSRIMEFTPMDIPLPSAYHYDRPTPGKNKQKNLTWVLLFLCFWRTEYCSNQSQGGWADI